MAAWCRVELGSTVTGPSTATLDEVSQMKHTLLITTCCTFLATLSGCEQGTGTYPPSTGDYVKNSGGQGTAKVWGIAFDVAEPVGSSAASRFDGSLSSDPEKTDARNEITIGDDVKFRLEKIPGVPITFEFNGKKYGTLEIGDKVSIDRERKVKVNGSLRQAE